MIFQKGSLQVRKLLPEDNKRLAKWLSDPAVLEYYEGRDASFDIEKVNKKFYHRNNGVERCLVLYKGESIGYIQYYRLNGKTSSLKEYQEHEITFGLDQFIGESSYWNGGIGTFLITTMVEYLKEQHQAYRVIMDPLSSNKRAIRCYEKCGFQKIKVLSKHVLHEGEYRDCLLMEYKRLKEGPQ